MRGSGGVVGGTSNVGGSGGNSNVGVVGVIVMWGECFVVTT